MPGEEDTEETYKEVCWKLGLVQDDREWEEALTDVAITKNCMALRELYVIFLCFCEPANPRYLQGPYLQGKVSSGYLVI